MASFTDLVAQSIFQRREEFLAGLSIEPRDEVEFLLAAEIQAHWHPLELRNNGAQERVPVAAIDGSHAIRALNFGADWIVAQALLIGPDGFRQSAVDTLLLRGEIERPAVDRCASLLMRSLELDLALKFVQSGAGKILLLDGSLYSDLPYLLYNLAIGGYEHFPLRVLEQYLELFDLCQKRDILLLGLAKRTRATVLGRAILDQRNFSPISTSYQADAVQMLDADVQDAEVSGATLVRLEQEQNRGRDMHKLPSDGELLHRWTKGSGLTDPVLLGSASFGRASAQVVAQLALQVKQPVYESALSSAQQRMAARLTSMQERLLAAPAIGTFYVRLAPGEDVLRVDAPASTFGRSDLRLLDFAQALISYTTALPMVRHLVDDYGGLSVYNAALYVVDQEVRLRAETVDHVYLPVLRRQVGYPIQYDRSTRRFNR